MVSFQVSAAGSGKGLRFAVAEAGVLVAGSRFRTVPAGGLPGPGGGTGIARLRLPGGLRPRGGPQLPASAVGVPAFRAHPGGLRLPLQGPRPVQLRPGRLLGGAAGVDPQGGPSPAHALAGEMGVPGGAWGGVREKIQN